MIAHWLGKRDQVTYTLSQTRRVDADIALFKNSQHPVIAKPYLAVASLMRIALDRPSLIDERLLAI